MNLIKYCVFYSWLSLLCCSLLLLFCVVILSNYHTFYLNNTIIYCVIAGVSGFVLSLILCFYVPFLKNIIFERRTNPVQIDESHILNWNLISNSTTISNNDVVIDVSDYIVKVENNQTEDQTIPNAVIVNCV